MAMDQYDGANRVDLDFWNYQSLREKKEIQLMTKRSKILLPLIALLLAANLFFWFRDPSRQSLDFDPMAFAVEDTASLSSITFEKTGLSSLLEKSESGWTVNSEFPVDANLLRVFKSVMTQLRVKRQISDQELQSLVSRIRNEGTEVSITSNDGKLLFTVLGNETKTRTYFITADSETGYEVEIPGYSDYIGGIFNLQPNQWRDRLIFSGNWRTIQSLTIDYTNEQYGDLDIRFEGDFFTVKGVQELDSNQVVGFFDQFSYLQANEIITGTNYPRYDSLKETAPFLTMNIDDIKLPDTYQLKIFPPLEGESVLLVTDNKGEMMVFSENRIQNFFAQPQDFIYQPAK
jgi:hypothetical protein